MRRDFASARGMFSALLILLLPATVFAQPATARQAEDRETGGNRLGWTPNDVHVLLIDEAAQFAEGTTTRDAATVHTSRVIDAPFPFNDVIPSWNVDVPAGAGFTVEIRLGRKAQDFWTPYYYLGTWAAGPKLQARLLKDDNGWINQDYFQSRNRFDRLQYRFYLSGPTLPVMRRVALACSNTLDDAQLAARHRRSVDPGPREKWARRLAVPWRSQNWESARLRGQCCSPTSVAMVLEYYGIKLTTEAVCRAVYDPEYRLYGNWWRAVQAAYSLGVPGYIERFGDWDAVKLHIARGEPIITSIRVQRGDLRHAPLRSSGGHLMVLTGFDADGNVCINDPAGRSAEKGQVTYHRDDMKKVWMDHGGVGYVLTAPPAAAR